MKYSIAFYDIDGVLSIPRYRINDKLKVGGSKDWWENFCKNNPNPYKDCKVSDSVYESLRSNYEAGTDCYVLSVETVTEAKEAKIKFIKDNYGDYFDDNHILFVSKDEEKVPFMVEMIENLSLDPSDTYFLDDTFALVCDASARGINAEHISWFLSLKGESTKKILTDLQNEIVLMKNIYERNNNPYGDRLEYTNPYIKVINIIDKYKMVEAFKE